MMDARAKPAHDEDIVVPSFSRNGYAVVAGGARLAMREHRVLRRASKDGPQVLAAILRDAAQARGSSG
jgi:hypothetical protein